MTIANGTSTDGVQPTPETPEPWHEALVQMGEDLAAAQDARDDAETAKEAAEDAAERTEQAVVHTPYIGTNNHWMVWNTQTGAYTDTGVVAVGLPGAKGDPGEDGDDAPQIDDTQASTEHPWSGAKIQSEIGIKADLTSGQNLNDLTTVGTYFCGSSVISGSLLNKPFDYECIVQVSVVPGVVSGYRFQFVHTQKTDGSLEEIFYRSTFSVSGSTYRWNPWIKLSTGSGGCSEDTRIHRTTSVDTTVQPNDKIYVWNELLDGYIVTSMWFENISTTDFSNIYLGNPLDVGVQWQSRIRNFSPQANHVIGTVHWIYEKVPDVTNS